MYNTFKIAKFVSSRSYFFEDKNSRAYVSNEKLGMNYLFEGKSADIWTVIYKQRNYNAVFEYASRIGLENQLDNFFAELCSCGLILLENDETTEIETPKYDLNTVELNSEREMFEKERNFWFRKNGLFIQLILELTYNCNLNCIHCYNDKVSGFMPFEKVKTIIDSADKMGFYAICLTGGKCMLHENFFEIAEYIKQKGLNLFIYTNAQRLSEDEEFFEKFVTLYPSAVKVSLYSMNPDLHDKITSVKGSHKKTIAAIKKMKEKNIAVRINFFLMHENYSEMEGVQNFAKELGIPFVADSRFTNNVNRKNSATQISNVEYKLLFNRNDNYFAGDLDIDNNIDEEFLSKRICNAGDDRLSISPSLDVYPCSGVAVKLGNINDASLEDIVNGEIFKDFKKKFIKQNMIDCYKEEYCKNCFYCPSLNYNTSDLFSKVDLCCERAKILFDINKKGDSNAR